MSNNIRSAQYRITQRSKFDVERSTIQPYEWKKTSLFIMDSGITDVECLDFFKGDDIEGYTDNTGHGNSLATIAKELSPNVDIYNVKITDNEGLGTTKNFIDAFSKIKAYAEENDEPVIVNCSWEAKQDKALRKVISELVALPNVHLFTAVGMGPGESTLLPATVKGVYKVGGLNLNLEPLINQRLGADFYLPSGAVAYKDGMVEGTSIACIMAATIMSMTYSYTEAVREVFESMINPKSKILHWAFAVSDSTLYHNHKVNVFALPTAKDINVYKIARSLEGVLVERFDYVIEDTKKIDINHNLDITPVDVIEDEFTFTCVAKFRNFEIKSQPIVGYFDDTIIEDEPSDYAESKLRVKYKYNTSK